MATSNKSPTLWSRYVDVVGVVDRGVNYALGEWGAFVAHRPVITIVVSSIISLGLMGGLVLIADNIESESDKLWYVCRLSALCSCPVFLHHGVEQLSSLCRPQLSDENVFIRTELMKVAAFLILCCF